LISVLGLAVAWPASYAGAQGANHETHTSISFPSQEVVAGIAHGTTQGAVVFLAGLVAFTVLVWLPVNRAEDDKGESVLPLYLRWMWLLVGLLVVAGLVELPVYAVRASGETLSLGLLVEALFGTRVGLLWIARLGLGLLVAAAATYALQRRKRTYWWGAAVVAALLLVTLTQQSHAAAEGNLLPFAADWLHLVAASVWMGGLLGFPVLLIGPLRAMLTEPRVKLLSLTVRRFSKVATLAVMTLILTGTYAILLHVPSVEGLLGTPYGRALMIKLGLAVFLFAAGGTNLVLKGRGPFGHIVSIELILALCIFVATGFLTTLPPADTDQRIGEEDEVARTESARQSHVPAARAQPTEEPASKVDVVVRMSGTPGIYYLGAYGEPVKGAQAVDGTLGIEPTDYELKVEDSASGSVSAAFRKTLPGEGTLKLEILADGEVVTEREASAESTSVAASWIPRGKEPGGRPREEPSGGTVTSRHH
jgi:copper transport protein